MTLIDMYIISDSTIFFNYTGAYIKEYIDSKKLQCKKTYIGDCGYGSLPQIM